MLGGFVPRWLSNRKGLNTGFKILWVPARVLDGIIEAALEGVRCWLPGYAVAPVGQQLVDASTALPYAGRSRGILQGEAESSAAYASRLQAWRTTWENAGSDELLVAAIQSYLGNTPTVRVVNRAGAWTSIAPDGTITRNVPGTASAPAWTWNWDSVTAPERAGWWSDMWIVVSPCEWAVTGTQLSDLVGLWGTYNGGGLGHACGRAAVGAILSLVAQWKGAHTWVPAIIWTYDATLFDPTQVNAGNPDGTWAYWGKSVGGNIRPSRTGATDGRCRYWTPRGGG